MKEEKIGIMWRVHASFVKDTNGKDLLQYGQRVIKFEWGWTVGMSEEKLSNLAEDVPKENACIFLIERDAKELLNKLNSLLYPEDE